MYPVSNAVKALFDAEQKQVLRITGVDSNGTAISITDANVLINGFNIDRYSCNGQKLEIGTAIASQLELKLNNADGTYDSIIFEGSELFVEIGIADWSQQTPTITYIPCGYFTPDEQPRKLSTISLKALDRMTRFDATHPTLTPWTTGSGDYVTDSQGNIIYFCAELSFPCTVAELVQQSAVRCSVPFTQDLSSFPNYNYQISALPVLQQEITFRNIIQWCAGIMGTCAYIDWNGKLRFGWYSSVSYTSTMAKRYASDLQENDITITGVTYTNTQNVSIVSGTPDYALDMTGNYLAATGIAEILPNVNTALNGFTYRPFSASVINAPYLWPLDVITFTDKDGNDHSCAVTNVNFGLNTVTKLEGKGETSQQNDGKSYSGATKEEAFLIEQAAEATRQLDDSLNQEGIFNRLTNEGEAQGIYLYNGQLYVNMSYARSGTLVLGGLNNQNGLLEVRDASNNVIGSWNNDGINVNKGTIQGPSIVVGGNNNANGTITVKDASGNVIGSWGNTGASIKDGSLEFDYVNGDYCYINKNNIPLKIKTTDINNDTYTFELRQGQIYFYNTQRDQEVWITPNIISLWNTSDNNYFDIFDHGIIFNNSMYFYKENGTYILEVGDRANNNGNARINGNLTVSGTKSRAVSTDQYSDRLLYCYETPSPMFGDIGEGVIADDGLCYITLDAVFAQTITTDRYQVFLQKYGDGDCWIKERKGGYFIVQGTPGMAFGWEIKAKQRDYDQRRLDKADEPFTPEHTDYGAEAAQYIEQLKKEREIA